MKNKIEAKTCISAHFYNIQDTERLKAKGQKKICHASINFKKMAMLTSKLRVKVKSMAKNQEGLFSTLKRSIQQQIQ